MSEQETAKEIASTCSRAAHFLYLAEQEVKKLSGVSWDAEASRLAASRAKVGVVRALSQKITSDVYVIEDTMNRNLRNRRVEHAKL